MELDDLQDVWEAWGQADPLWAVLSEPGTEGGKWDVEEFFARGRTDVAALIETLDELGLPAGGRRALDFGCGVGRLTQALADHYDQVDGVDIAPSMIERARQLNRHGDRCTFHVNDRDDLAIFPDGHFDLVFSLIVLQHIPNDAVRGYLPEFVRLLAPGGVAVFQVLAGRSDQPRTIDFAAQVEVLDLPRTVGAGSNVPIEVAVTNTGSVAWPATEPFPVRVGNHWRIGDVVICDDGRTGFADDIAPGETVRVTIEATAPAADGPAELQVDLVQEQVAWFADRGCEAWRSDVDVSPSAPGAAVADADDGPADGVADAGEQPVAPRPFGMYTLPREEVEALLTAAGGTIAAARPDRSAGDEWTGYRYVVTRARTSELPVP